MGQLSVQRWRRFGHDRWYVNDEGGTSLGWMDARTGELHLHDEVMRQRVLDVLARYVGDPINSNGVTLTPGPASPPPSRGEPDATQVTTT